MSNLATQQNFEQLETAVTPGRTSSLLEIFTCLQWWKTVLEHQF